MEKNKNKIEKATPKQQNVYCIKSKREELLYLTVLTSKNRHKTLVLVLCMLKY